MILDNKDLELIEQATLRVLPLLTPAEIETVLGRSPDDAAFRAWLTSLDFEFFLRFYLRDMFPEPFCPLHLEGIHNLELLALQEGERRLAEIWPRGYGKSTLCAEGYPLWVICNALRHHILIISNTREQAKERIGNIKFQLETNERIEEDFGSLVGPVWTTEGIETSNFVKVAVYGAGNKIRGRKYIHWRPDLVILDDIENDKNVMSKLQRASLRRWFDQAITRVGWKNLSILMVGNYIHHAGLLKSLAENPSFTAHVGKAMTHEATNREIWDEWEHILTDVSNPNNREDADAFYAAHEQEMLEGAEVSWPEVYPYKRLMEIKVLDGRHTFYTELQNEPTDPDARFFKYRYYKREVRRDRDGNPELYLVPWDPEGGADEYGAPSGDPAVALSACATFGATDPSMGVGGKGDPYAIMVGARAPTGQCFLLEAEIDWRDPNYIIDRQEYFMRKYNPREWAIESNQFQAFFAMVSRASSMEKGLYQKIKAVPHTTDKHMRIMSIQPVLENGYMLVPLDGFTLWKQEADEWSIDHVPGHVDGLDATEMLWSIMRAPTFTLTDPVLIGEHYSFGQDKAIRPAKQEAREIKAERAVDRKALEDQQRERGEEPNEELIEAALWYPRIYG